MTKRLIRSEISLIYAVFRRSYVLINWCEEIYDARFERKTGIEGLREYGNEGWTIGFLGFDPGRGAGYFSLHHHVQNGSGAHLVSYPLGTRGSFPGVTRQGREADHSPPSSAEVKEWVESYVHSPIRLHGVVFS
jgi:hypothetical protein